jgi:hypothetical protein
MHIGLHRPTPLLERHCGDWVFICWQGGQSGSGKHQLDKVSAAVLVSVCSTSSVAYNFVSVLVQMISCVDTFGQAW